MIHANTLDRPVLNSDSKPQEDLLAYVQVMVQKEMAKQQQEMQVPPTKKRKRAARRKPVKVEKLENEGSSHDDTDSESSVEVIEKSASTARRILWQRGHNAILPSMKEQIIMNATVDSVAEAHGPLYEYGFAIVRDMTEAFGPKNRCTREQRDFITKCKTPITFLLPLIAIAFLTSHD